MHIHTVVNTRNRRNVFMIVVMTGIRMSNARAHRLTTSDSIKTNAHYIYRAAWENRWYLLMS